MKSTRIVLFGLLAVMVGGLMMFNSSHSEIFQWVDEKGGIHFTENPAMIPEKYRDQVQTKALVESPPTIPLNKISMKVKENQKYGVTNITEYFL